MFCENIPWSAVLPNFHPPFPSFYPITGRRPALRRLRRAVRFPAARLRCSPACSSPCLAIHPLSPASGAATRFRRRAAALRAGCFCMLFHSSIHFSDIIPQKSPRRALFFIYIEPLTAVDGSGISRYNTFYIYLCHTVFFFAGFPSGNSTFTGRGCLT